MSVLFTDYLKEKAADIREKNFIHPFVKGIVEGTLPFENFKYYILQDIYYLKHFGKVHALAASQAEDFKVTSLLAEKAKFTAEAELTVHKEHAEILGITDEDMNNFKPAPAAYGYTSHLYRAAFTGRVGDTIAALYPCYWLYNEIGLHFTDAKPGIAIYQNWLNTYASEWFTSSVKAQEDLLNDLAKDASKKELERMAEHFVIACEYELAFWDMAWNMEKWPSETNALSLFK
ncbi:MAG TPA: thiaminase II [Chondromyces sp.]|nr:thiaminase II [Chondromyces sp.]